MRVGSMDSIKEEGDRFIPYYFLAVVMAVVVGYIIIGVVKGGWFLFMLIIDYWWITILSLLGILMFRRYLSKRKIKREKG